MAVSNASQTVEENVVTLDRRQLERRSDEVNGSEPSSHDAAPRRKKQRRRHIDPTTCERDYSDQEIEFMRAMDDYKRDAGRMFPTCSEVLEVIRALGYHQLSLDQMDELGLSVTESTFEPATEEEEEQEEEFAQ